MGFDALLKLKEVEQAAKKAGHAAEGYINKKKSQYAAREAEKKRAAELKRLAEERTKLLDLIKSKQAGKGAEEMPPLRVQIDNGDHKAVFLVTVPIHFGRFELTKTSYKLLARHVGMTLDGVSHWALCVIDRGLGPCYCYDLMSDQMALNAIGKNYFRVNEIGPNFVETWNACYYVGETTKSHEVITSLGELLHSLFVIIFGLECPRGCVTDAARKGYNHMALHPRYNLMSNNCQDLVESLVKLLCDGKVISQAKLSEELSQLSPKIAMDMMVARLRSKTDVVGENENSDTVKEDVDILKSYGTRFVADHK